MGSLWGLVLVLAGFGIYAGWFIPWFQIANCAGIEIPYVNYCVGLSVSYASQILNFLQNYPWWLPIVLILSGLYIVVSK